MDSHTLIQALIYLGAAALIVPVAVRLGLASKQHVSTDYLLMGSEPSKEEVKNDLLSIISELSTIAKKI